MSRKTKFLSALVITSLTAGLGLDAFYRHHNPREPRPTTESRAPTSSPQEARSPKNPTQPPRKIGPGDVVDVQEWLEHGPKEPLLPPEIRINAEWAPGSVATSEPLTPPEIRINAELAPGSSTTLAPLTPPEIRIDAPTP